MMRGDQVELFSSKIQALVEANKNFPQKLERRLVSNSSEVENQIKFINELFNEGVLCEGSNDLEMLVQLAVTIGCSKGTDGIFGVVKALESSGNLRLISILQTWVQRDFQIESDADGSPSEPKEGTPAVQSPPRKKVLRNLASSTELCLANPPGPAATGIFAATSTGLIALDLKTLEATTLTRKPALAVAVNHNLKKVYWAEVRGNSRIMRSNFDGSDKEVIVPADAGGRISMLTVDEPSGNLYFALLSSHEIRVCNAIGKNGTSVISDSSLVNKPMDIALDSENGVMYWINNGPVPSSLVRANLDGSNGTKISTGFPDVQGITLDQPSNGLLYWADCEKHTIGTIDVNCGSKRTLVELKGKSGPVGIQVDARKIYIGNFYGKSIQSVDRDSGEELTTILEPEGKIYNLALIQAPVQQS